MNGIMIKANQRRIALERRCMAALRSGRGQVLSGRVDVTAECVSFCKTRIAAYLEANRILRGVR